MKWRCFVSAGLLWACGSSGVAGSPDASDGSVGDAGVDASPVTVPSYERPIDLVFKVHLEPQGSLEYYKKRRDDVESVRKLAEQYGLKLTIHGNGEFWQYAREQGDEATVRTWLANKHTVGPHMHTVYCNPDGEHAWRTAKDQETADPAFVDDLWKDHERELKALLPDVTITEATPFDCDQSTFISRMDAHGYTTLGGGREEISEQWMGHHPFHPWRIGGSYLAEDLGSKVVLVSHYAQFTEQDFHGPPTGSVFADQSLAHHQVGFLQIYLNRLHAERTGDAMDKVWVYGFLTHDNKSTQTVRAEIEKFLVWITTNFGSGKVSARGNAILKPSTMTDVYNDFIAWEKEHPATSSFNVKTPTMGAGQKINQLDEAQRKALYPGTFWGMAELLRADGEHVVDYVKPVDTFSGAGVSCHELSFGERGNATKRARRWLLWKETDGDVSIDMKNVAGKDTIRRWNPRDKTQATVSASAVAIGNEPVIVDVGDP